MQIIIVQAEIEAAIRAHIEQQVSIKEGMEITIDLRSTRGDAGFTANIDIVPAAPGKVKAVAQAPAPVPTPPAAVATKKEPEAAKGNTELNQGKEQLPASEGSTAGAAADSDGTAQTAGEDVGAEPLPEEGAAPAGEQPAETAAEAPKTRTLFTNLKRVNNG